MPGHALTRDMDASPHAVTPHVDMNASPHAVMPPVPHGLPTSCTLEQKYFLFSAACSSAMDVHMPHLFDGSISCHCCQCLAWDSYVRGEGAQATIQYQVLTQELVNGVTDWLLWHSLGQERVHVLEVGAGDGRLSHCLRVALSERDEHERISVIATDSHASGLIPLAQVEIADYRDALAKHKPTVVVCSWMPLGEDWTAVFRACETVTSYLLIGETDDGCCGRPWETWGYLADGACGCDGSDACSVSSTSSESSDCEQSTLDASHSARESQHSWRRVYEHSPARTPFGEQGWSRRELQEVGASALCRTDAPWCTTRHSHAVVFEREL
mmetsp:Transcript_31426/g.67567  ORF Transcript_31426/g.67567 Transcript_31426/m.67567 type:complete len:327 (-) Transcript_31426:17-997(-)